MVAQHQQVLVPQIVHDPRPFIQVQRDPFVIVIGQIVVHDHRKLRIAPQPVVLHRHRHTIRRMHMNHTARIVARRMNRRMNGEAGGVDEIRRVLTNVALQINLDQTRGRHLVKHQTVRVDQKAFFAVLVRQSRRNMCEHQIGPAVQCAQPVGRGQFNAQIPFFIRHFALQRGQCRRVRNVESRAQSRF